MKNLGIIDILQLYGFDPKNTKAKIVRHKQRAYPVEELLRNHWLDVYQSYQSQPLFDNLDVIISFYGLNGTRSCFYGVFAVIRRQPGKNGLIPVNCPWVHEWRKQCPYFYELKRITDYKTLEHRLVIDWGGGAIKWDQNLSNKPVLEILAAGRKLPVFEDYLEFSLSHHELKDLYRHADAHRDWQSALQAVAGVYLILAQTSGKLYVGSAYGAAGVWGRWAQYAKTGDGGNELLKALVAKDPDYPEQFSFSLLQILPKTLTRAEVIKREGLYKHKLGSLAHGLNLQ